MKVHFNRFQKKTTSSNNLLGQNCSSARYIEKRIKYYLGDVFNHKYEIQFEEDLYKAQIGFCFLSKNNLFCEPRHSDIYALLNELKLILLDDKIRYFFLGDLMHKCENPILCKNRVIGDQIVILLDFFHSRYFAPIKEAQKNDIKWTNKDDKVVWRGESTGKISKEYGRYCLVLKFYNHNIFDISFALITKDYFINSRMDLQENEAIKITKNYLNIQTQLKSKYLVSVEGNDVASGLPWKLSSNSIVLTAHLKYETWFMEGLLKEWIHYVPLLEDYSDLEEKWLWCKSHQEQCLEIVKNANLFANQFSNPKQESELNQKILEIYSKNVSVTNYKNSYGFRDQ